MSKFLISFIVGLLIIGSFGFMQNIDAQVNHGGNPCDSEPCQNGGVCVNDLNAFHCECPQNFVGFFCEIFLDSDLDGIADNEDNCVFSANPDQSDLDGDGLGDVCDATPNPFEAFNIVDVTVNDFSNPDDLQSSGNYVSKEYASQNISTTPVSVVGNEASFSNHIGWIQAMKVDQPNAPNFALLYRHNVGYEMEFTVEDPLNLGYTITVDDVLRGYVTADMAENIQTDAGAGLMLGRLDVNDGNGPVHYAGFATSGGGVRILPDEVTPQTNFIEKSKSYTFKNPHSPGIDREFFGTNTFVISFSSYPSYFFLNLFQNNGGGEGALQFGVLPTLANAACDVNGRHCVSEPSQPDFDYAYNTYDHDLSELGHFVTVRVNSLGIIDADGDGFAVGVDCDDNNPAINPDADDSVCDGVDNNCNDEIDEGFVQSPTSCGVGQCLETGFLSCIDGNLIDSCIPGEPTSEMCDALDNDCDGTVDDEILMCIEACSFNGQLDPTTGFCNCDTGFVGDLCEIPDSDNDGIGDDIDNCPDTPNTDQADVDGDGVGDVCDNCPDTPNADQADANENGIGDACEILEVIMDVKPDSDDNPINCNSKGVTPTAVFSSANFDATQIDPPSLQLESSPFTESHNKLHLEDVNRDGLIDVVLHIDTQDICKFLPDGTPTRATVSITMTGSTIDGQEFEGTDEIALKGKKIKEN